MHITSTAMLFCTPPQEPLNFLHRAEDNLLKPARVFVSAKRREFCANGFTRSLYKNRPSASSGREPTHYFRARQPNVTGFPQATLILNRTGLLCGTLPPLNDWSPPLNRLLKNHETSTETQNSFPVASLSGKQFRPSFAKVPAFTSLSGQTFPGGVAFARNCLQSSFFKFYMRIR